MRKPAADNKKANKAKETGSKNRKDENNNQRIAKPRRTYINDATKAAVHPVRVQILKALKDGPLTSMELESVTGEARYNLYHHLDALAAVGLIQSIPVDKKTKRYELIVPHQPEAAAIVISQDEMRARPEEFAEIISVIGRFEGSEIPHPERIARAEICFYYSWDKQ